MFNGFDVLNVVDLVAEAPNPSVINELYKNDDAMFEPATVGEVSRAFMADSEPEQDLMLEAVTSTRMRLGKTMKAFIRVLNQTLNGTGLTAGSDGAELSEGADRVVGGAEVGKVRRVGGIPVMVALIPISDGQSVSILFHSPTSNGKSIKSDDTLTAFKFLLNKKDITHIVAPIRGRDVTLRQTCMSISNLVEKNSDKFRKRQAMNNTMRAQIEKTIAESEDKDNQLQSIIEDADRYRDQAQSVIENTSSTKDELAKQLKINADLERQIERAKKVEPVKDTGQSLLSKMGNNLTEAVALAGGGKIEATPDGIELTDKEGKKHVFKVPRSRDIAEFEQSQKDAVSKVFAAFEAGNLDEVIAANDPVQEEKPPVVELQDINSGISALSELTNIDANVVDSWVKKHNMALTDLTSFINDESITDQNKIDYVQSGVKYPEEGESVAELRSHFDAYIAYKEDLSRFAPKDVKRVASLIIQDEIATHQERSNRINSVISMADGSDFSTLPPQYVLASQAAVLVISALGSKADQKAMVKAIGASIQRTKATTLLSRLRKADELLIANGLEPLFSMNKSEDPPAEEKKPDGDFVYLLKARPAGPGTIPEGSVTVHTEYSGDYSDVSRFGSVTYDTPLTEDEMSQYELIKVPGEPDLLAMAGAITSDIEARGLAEKYVEMDSDTIQNYVKPLLANAFPYLPKPNDADMSRVLEMAMTEIRALEPKKPTDEMQQVIDFLKTMVDYSTPTIGDAQEKQAQISSAIMTLAEAGRLDEFEELAESAVNNVTKNLKSLMG